MHPARTALCLAALGLHLAACAPSTPAAFNDGLTPIDQPCGAGRLSNYYGEPLSHLPAKGPWSVMRVIKPGMGVTMDYAASRLNVHLDDAGKIHDLTCG